MPDQHNILLAFAYTSMAGISTVFGAIFVFFFRRCYRKFLPWGLGFSAGIMLYLSFFDLLREAKEALMQTASQNPAAALAMFFIIGLATAGIMDMLTHRYMGTCPNGEVKCKIDMEPIKKIVHQNKLMMHAGLFTMVALALHNFPEGIATFSATTVNSAFGLSIALAIAIHNVPEGFCIALPVYNSSGSYRKSIIYTLIAGLAEPLGALITYLFLYPFINEFIMGGMLAAVAGIMVYVSLDSLFPTAKNLSNWHVALMSTVVGMAAMFLVSNLFLH